MIRTSVFYINVKTFIISIFDFNGSNPFIHSFFWFIDFEPLTIHFNNQT